MSSINDLFLPDQVCFPLYASSRMITRLYQPLLDEIGLTYTQYLVMLALWEEDKLSIGELGNRLFLNTNTLTPLIKKLKEKDLVDKTRSASDERTVFISLSKKGKALQAKAKHIPKALIESLNMSDDDVAAIRDIMWRFLRNFDVAKTTS